MKVSIRMDTVQKVDGEEELIHHETRGILRREGALLKLTYLLDGIHHEMEIDTETFSVSVVRNFQEKSSLLYKKGLKHPVLYETPVGAMELSFHTKQVLMSIPDQNTERVMLDMLYEVFQFGTSMMECELRVEILPMR